MRRRTLLVLHHDDLDGEASAAVIVGANLDADVVCVAMNYKDAVPLDALDDVDEVYIVDFSLGEVGAWAGAIAKWPCLTWIDHHISAIRNAPAEALALPGIREEGSAAGCLLTWRYLYPDDAPPRALELISDYDTWTHAFPETRAFKAGLETGWDTRPVEGQSETWAWLLWLRETETYEVRDVISLGERVLQKRVLESAALVKAWGFEVDFEGLRGIALNRNQIGSDTFASVAADYDVLLPFVFDGTRHTVSVYRGGRRLDLDCAAIAQKYGGGGHPGAAGFQCEALPWTPLGEAFGVVGGR